MNQDINFLRDTFLFEEFEKSCFPKPLNKNAGLFEDLGLNSVGEYIKSFAKDYFKDSSEVPGGYFTSLLNIMAPAVLFRINPFLAALYGLFSMFGFSLSDIVTKIAEALEPKLSKGEPVTPQEINNAAASIGGAADISNASDSFFVSAAKDGTLSQYTFEYFIKEASYLQEKDKYKLTKKADKNWYDFMDPEEERKIKQRRSQYGKRKIPFLSGGGKEVSILQRIFGNLFSKPDGVSRIKWFGVGFAVWILKTVLAGAGLLIVGGVAAKMLGLTGDSKKETTPETPGSPTESKTETKEQPSSTSTTSTEQSDKVWIVPLVGNGSIQDTIRIWVLDLHRDLNQYPDIDNIIYSSPKFKKLISELSSDLSKVGKKYLQMPSRYSSRKQVVNEFIDEIRRNINVP